MATPPETSEGWYALHEFRRVDWDAWRETPQRKRKTALREGEEFLAARESLEDADAGASAVFSVLGHKADLLFVHFRPTAGALDRIERSFENTALAGVTERVDSYVSVTEVSGYISDDFEDPESVDEGLKRYIEGKLTPDIPGDTYVSFYPMSKRRGEEHNWYDLDFEERAELMSGHGDVGREYAGEVKQVISSSVGLDDYEWGVTLFADELTTVKDLVYEMRFDEATSKYGEFGSFRVGRRFPPSDLRAFFAGEEVPTGGTDEADETGAHGHAEGHPGEGESEREPGHGNGGADDGTREDGEGDDIREQLSELDVYAGQPHGEDTYAVVVYSDADVERLESEATDLAESFDHYDSHEGTAVYEGEGEHAVVSRWETSSAADTAAGFLTDLPGVTRKAGEAEDGWGTMGMFYTVKPEYREDFEVTFEEVGELLSEMEGHRETELLHNREDGNDMFIASQWDSKENAMAFFRSDEFAETVKWGRDVLADRPRHVFLA